MTNGRVRRHAAGHAVHGIDRMLRNVETGGPSEACRPVASDVRTADPALDGGYGTDVAGLPAREPRRVRMFGWIEGRCLSFSFRAGRTGARH